MVSFTAKLAIALSESNQETVDTRVYHEIYLSPAAFVQHGYVDQKEARQSGFDSDDTVAQFAPQQSLIGLVLDQPDVVWIDMAEMQLRAWVPQLAIENIKIVDKDSNGRDVLVLKYIADVNLDQFARANLWSKRRDMEDAIKAGTFKIVRKLV